jgi:hypothetical protein
MKDQLEEVLFELKSAELVIEILQKERELYKMEEGRVGTVTIVIISVTTVKAIFTRQNSQYLSPVLTPVNMMMAIFGTRNFYKMLATTLAVLILVKSVRTLAHGPEKMVLSFRWHICEELRGILLEDTVRRPNQSYDHHK